MRKVLAFAGYSVGRIEPEERKLLLGHKFDDTCIPEDAEKSLTYQNDRLLELEHRYSRVESAVCTHTQWKAELNPESLDLRQFRGDNAYVWQYRQVRKDMRLKYYLFTRYIHELDAKELMGSTLTEDGAFGCFTHEYETLPVVSRDLLDSINEIYFLERNWGLFGRSDIKILDIGAGYGRLAHRMLSSVEGISKYWCIDAIARSTFLCEYYLGYRGFLDGEDRRASVIPLDEMESAVPRGAVDLAINIHSFSEMSHDAVAGWCDYLGKLEVPWLMVIPNELGMLTKEADNSRREYRSLIEHAGYRLKAQEPTINDPDIRELFSVRDYFFLFERV